MNLKCRAFECGQHLQETWRPKDDDVRRRVGIGGGCVSLSDDFAVNNFENPKSCKTQVPTSQYKERNRNKFEIGSGGGNDEGGW